MTRPTQAAPRPRHKSPLALTGLLLLAATTMLSAPAMAQRGPGPGPGPGPGAPPPAPNPNPAPPPAPQPPPGNAAVVANPVQNVAGIATPVPGPVIAATTNNVTPAGTVSTFQPGGATPTTNHAFFQQLGTNQRTCFTCHQPQSGWSITPRDVSARFNASQGNDPLFRTVDGATCSTADVSTTAARLTAYNLLITRGLIRVGQPMPTASEFAIAVTRDPYSCSSNPATGLTSATTGTVSLYRRPLPSTNLKFSPTIMWDGRENSLAQQAVDATTGHAQATGVPAPQAVQQILAFEQGLFTAQSTMLNAGALNSLGATGGPQTLANLPFFVGINDPSGQNPTAAGFNPNVFTLFTAWAGNVTNDLAGQARAQIVRGQALFNNRQFNIAGVGGLNDVTGVAQFRGTCSSCHNTPNVGSRSINALMDIGVSRVNPPALNAAVLPVFTVTCTTGAQAGRTVNTTDPGQALVTGRCADINRFKVPSLRGLDSRAPYFHNGLAEDLTDVVAFYNARFNMGLNAQERADLTAFLRAL